MTCKVGLREVRAVRGKGTSPGRELTFCGAREPSGSVSVRGEATFRTSGLAQINGQERHRSEHSQPERHSLEHMQPERRMSEHNCCSRCRSRCRSCSCSNAT